jgi:hypothetical protein
MSTSWLSARRFWLLRGFCLFVAERIQQGQSGRQVSVRTHNSREATMSSDTEQRTSISADPEQLLERLRADFPGHRIWRTLSGDVPKGWAATRIDPEAGVSPTVICDRGNELREALLKEKQARHTVDADADRAGEDPTRPAAW